jgi:uncharacterized protein YkwD
MGGSGTAGTRWRVSRVALGTSALAALLALWLWPAAAPAAAACPHAGAEAHEISLSKLRKTMICLVNRERAKRDRRALDPNPRLKRAAQQHNRVMLAKSCFRHNCPGEPGLGRRIKRSGYTDGQRSWRFAEDLGFDRTPRKMMKRWLRSSFNRGNLLDRGFRDLGVGVGWGAPRRGVDDSQFATYTLVFGLRRPRN